MNELDEELAAATDALLNGQEPISFSGENEELAEVVRQLHRVIDPDRPLATEFERRLTQRLNSEWDRVYTPPLRLLDRPLVRVGLAAAVVLVLGAMLLLMTPDSPEALQGTAIGLNHAAALFVLGGVLVAGTVLAWRNRR